MVHQERNYYDHNANLTLYNFAGLAALCIIIAISQDWKWKDLGVDQSEPSSMDRQPIGGAFRLRNTDLSVSGLGRLQ